MLAFNPLHLSLFFSLAVLLTVATTANANIHPNLPVHRRAQSSRFLKKRLPLPQPPIPTGALAVAPDPPTPLPSDPPPSSAITNPTLSPTPPVSVSAPISAAAPPPATPSVTPASASGTGLVNPSIASSGSSTSGASSSSSSVPLSSASSASSSSASPTSEPPPSVTAAPSVPPANLVTSPPSSGRVTKTVTSSAADNSSTASATPASSTSTITKATLTVIIVIASCVGGSILIWTIIRKWKFRPSSQFEDRMQPIDWQPSVNAGDDGLPGHRRANSNASHGSFHSGSDQVDGNVAGRGRYGYEGSSDHGHGGAYDLPAHDFTAGPAHLNPVGGYADLARGPSPQPYMQETLVRGPSLNRGPSVNRGYGNPAYPTAGPTSYGAHDAYDYNGHTGVKY